MDMRIIFEQIIKQSNQITTVKKVEIKNGLIFITATLISIILLSSCGNSKEKQDGQAHSEVESETKHEHFDTEHSQLMNETREWLIKELGDKYNQPVPPVTAHQLEQGKEIFLKYCATCHGNSGKGDGQAAAALQTKPSNFTDPRHSSFYSDQGRILIIKKGIKVTAMAGWENTLNEEEILSVYAYVKALKNSIEMMEHHEH